MTISTIFLGIMSFLLFGLTLEQIINNAGIWMILLSLGGCWITFIIMLDSIGRRP